jgi:hypothetical protein
MSAIGHSGHSHDADECPGGKADITIALTKCLLLTQSGHDKYFGNTSSAVIKGL